MTMRTGWTVTRSGDASGWQTRLRRGVIELVTIFVGVTAAFFVEGYRSDLEQREQLGLVTSGLVVELGRHEIRSLEHADSIRTRIAQWRTADAAGRRAIPGYYIIPGSPYPPTAAWDAAVSSGVASQYDPSLRLELGYYYVEFLGIHDNYIRRVAFIEREVMPLARSGPDGFYDASGSILPTFAAEMDLLADFGEDLARLSEWAGTLRARLEALEPGG